MIWDSASVDFNFTDFLNKTSGQDAKMAGVEIHFMLTQLLTIIVLCIAVLAILFFFVAW